MKKLILFFTSLLCFCKWAEPVYAQEFLVPAKHAVAIEVSTGKILYDQDSQTPASIASITKLLSVYLVYEALEKGDIQPSTMVAISDYPYSLTTNPLFSNVNLDQRSYSVDDLLKASLITSSNSAIIALAEEIAGSEPAFVDRMRTKLKDWGITDAHIVNVSGLDNADLGEHIYPGSTPEDSNRLSALDVAIVARRLITDYPQVLTVTSQSSYLFGQETYYSTNQMLSERSHAREGVDGLKTGTSESSGASFVATSTQNNMRIITVVLNATDGNLEPNNRFVATNSLMNYVYEQFTMTTLISKGQTLDKQTVAIFNGQSESSPIVASRDLQIPQRVGQQEGTTTHFEAASDLFDAPLSAGHKVGQLKAVDKDLIGKGYIEELPHVDMVLPKDVHQALWPLSWWNQFVRYVNHHL